MSTDLKRGCHAVVVGIDFADAPIVKITQPVSISSAISDARQAVPAEQRPRLWGQMNLIAIRPRGTVKWTLYKFHRPIMTHRELDVLRMRAALEGL